MRITKDNTVALIIDVQEKLCPHMTDNDRLKKSITILLQGLKLLEVPIILTEQYTKGLGPSIQEIREVIPAIFPLEKMAFSCCDEESILEKLKQSKRKMVLLAGIETHVCVLQTALDLIEKGYLPVVIRDCVSSRKISDMETAFIRMHQEGVRFTSVESLLFELTRSSGTDLFKSISRLVK